MERVPERSRQAAVPSLAPLPQAALQRGLPYLGEYLRPCPLQLMRCAKTKNMAQMREHSKTSELSDEETASLSDGEFKALAIKMVTELI